MKNIKNKSIALKIVFIIILFFASVNDVFAVNTWGHINNSWEVIAECSFESKKDCEADITTKKLKGVSGLENITCLQSPSCFSRETASDAARIDNTYVEPSQAEKKAQTPPTQISPGKDTTTANTAYKLLAPIGDLTELKASDDIGKYFNIMIKIAIGLCAVLAVVMIVIGGIQYMGKESIFSKVDAKAQITRAIFGLIIALGSYALLNTISPALLGGNGLKIKTVSAEIINLPDAGDGIIDSDFKTGKGTYSTDATLSPGVSSVVNKLKNGWVISQFKVYTNNRMLILIKKGNEVDNTNVIDVASGINGFSETTQSKVGDKKTPKGTWKILEIRTASNKRPVYNATGSNMGASFWLLSPMTNGERGIGMHGNKSGTLTSTYGCIRLKNADILALLPYIKTGITVNIGD